MMDSPIKIQDNLQGQKLEELSKILLALDGELPKEFGNFPSNPTGHHALLMREIADQTVYNFVIIPALKLLQEKWGLAGIEETWDYIRNLPEPEETE